MKSQSNFETTDITLASTLAAHGFAPDSINRSSNGRVDFVFLRREGLDELVDKFWKRTVRVDPLDFANAQRYLKSRLHNPTPP